MIMLLTILFYAILAVFGIILLLFLLFMAHYIPKFHMHKCKHCGKYMKYMGLRDDENCGHYLFHCEHCGAWQQIPKEEMLRT